MSSPHGSPYRGGMPKERANNGDSSSSDSEAVWPGGAYINLTPREKKIRSNTLKTRTKVCQVYEIIEFVHPLKVLRLSSCTVVMVQNYYRYSTGIT